MKKNHPFHLGSLNSSLTILFLIISTFSFSQEICDNGIDDDGDGLIDCLDPDCLSSLDCPAFQVPGGCLPIGYYPDIIGNEAGFKPSGSTADVNIPITTNSERLTLVIQGVYQQGTIVNSTGTSDLNYGEERLVWGRVEVDLINQTSSGWVEYFSCNHDNRRFSWVDEPLGTNMTNTYPSIVGHDFSELTDFNFSFNQSGTNFVVGCGNSDTDIAYYTVNYGNSSTESLTRIDGANITQYPSYFAAGTYTQTIDMQAGANAPNYVILRSIGINQNRYGTNGVLVGDTREETSCVKYIVCDLNTMTASGIMTINGGNIPDMNSSFVFQDYDLTTGNMVVANSTITGDAVGNTTPPNQIAVSDMSIEVSGNQLIITRSNEFGDDYNEMYYVEFLQYTGQPYSSSFFITKNTYSSPYDIGYDSGASNNGIGVLGIVDFTIPTGAKRAYVEMRANGDFKSLNLSGPTTSYSNLTNGNQMYSFAEINFDLNQTTGYYATLTTSTQQQIYAWQNVPFGYGNINVSGVYGQTPNNDERIDFEFVAPDILRVFLTNDNIAYERIIQATFLGSKVNLVYSSFDQNSTIFTGCDSVYFDMEICNSGGADLAQTVPISFYTGDPTTDANAIYLQTADYDLNIDQGQCETYTFAVDITSLGGATSGDITIVLNDNGSYSGTPGNQIPATFNVDDLDDQGNSVLECEFDQNVISASWTQPLPSTEPSITFNNNSVSLCPGDTETFIATANDSNGETNWQWTPGGTADTTNTITVDNSYYGWYYLTLTDACFTVTDSVKVSSGEAGITGITIVDAINCPGQSSPTLGSVSVTPDNSGWSYTLGSVGPQNSGNFTNIAGGQTYLLSITNDVGCTTDSLIEVGIDAAVAVTADWIQDSLRDVTCFGDLDGGAAIENIQGGITAPYDVTWTHVTDGDYSTSTLTAGSDDEIDNLYGGQWIISVVDQLGCAWSQAFEIYEPDQLVADLSNYSEPSCFDLNDGDITVVISGGNSITSGVGSVTISNSSGTTLNSSVSDLTVNNLITDTYTVTVVDDNGCTVTETLFIDQPDEIDIDYTVVDPLCYGIEAGMITIDTVYNYQGSYDDIYYYWNPNPNGTNGYGETTNAYLAEGDYELKITDANDCYKFFNFTINYPDSLYFDEFDFLPAICRNQVPFDNGHGQIYASVSGGSDGNGNGLNILEQYWMNETTGQIYTSGSTVSNLDPGYYTFTYINDLGCELSNTLYVDSLSPQAIFDLTSDDFTSAYEGTANVDVVVTNLSTDYNYTNYPYVASDPNDVPDPNADWTFTWTFSSANDTSLTYYQTADVDELIQQTYTSEGVYEICLIVTENLNGCVDTTCQDFIVHDYPELETPNVFTPGSGDGINDYFYFPNTGIMEFHCAIFDRWGKQVYELNDINELWDGTNMNNGKDCSDGVYFYMYEATATNGTEFTGQGNVHIVRK